MDHRPRILWSKIIFWLLFHLVAIYGVFTQLLSACLLTLFWAVVVAMGGTLGFTAGVHRLWAHRTYRATWPLKATLLALETASPMGSAFDWIREHRVHHKFSDTDADPHNIGRGFFFSHVGWLLMEPHPECRRRLELEDVSDLLADTLIMFQKRWLCVLWPLCCVLVPSAVPCMLWGEDYSCSLLVVGVVRTLVVLHVKWAVNSVAHTWGRHPYDSTIRPAENVTMSLLALGEGWHNYHHVFPWDYKTAELGNYRFNITTAFIDFFAWVGLAYDLKTASQEIISQRIKRTGSGSNE